MSERETVTEAAVMAARLAIVQLRGAEAGGCFRPDDVPQGECVDGDCYCARQCEAEARAALAAALPLIVAGERERCAKIADHYFGPDSFAGIAMRAT